MPPPLEPPSNRRIIAIGLLSLGFFASTSPSPDEGSGTALSPREDQIIALAASGMIDKEICRQLGITENTMRTYWKRIRSKMGVQTRTGLVAAYLRQVSAKLAEQFEVSDDGEWPRLAMVLSTELRRAYASERCATRALAVLDRVIGELPALQSEHDVYALVCDGLVEVGGYVLASVSKPLQDARKGSEVVARAGDRTGYLDDADMRWDESEHGQGPFGRAVRTGKPQVNRDFQVDPSMAPWKEAAERVGFHSSIGLPVLVDGHVVAVLSLYAPEPDAFDERELHLLCQVTALVAFKLTTLA